MNLKFATYLKFCHISNLCHMIKTWENQSNGQIMFNTVDNTQRLIIHILRSKSKFLQELQKMLYAVNFDMGRILDTLLHNQ